MDPRPRWAPRVERSKIRRLYETDASGMLDADLLDDVAYAIWERCRDIVTVTQAHAGRAACPSCERVVEHGWDKDEELVCSCGWRLTWGEYLASYQRKQLHGGGAISFFEEYLEGFEGARSAREKMLLIDRLLHRFHHELSDRPSRVAAVNVIEGRMHDVFDLLESLARADERSENLDDFVRNSDRADEIWGRKRSREQGV